MHNISVRNREDKISPFEAVYVSGAAHDNVEEEQRVNARGAVGTLWERDDRERGEAGDEEQR